MNRTDRLPNSIHGVICRAHGRQGLNDQDYSNQLAKADEFWKCPVCGADASWDDERYERGINSTD